MRQKGTPWGVLPRMTVETMNDYSRFVLSVAVLLFGAATSYGMQAPVKPLVADSLAVEVRSPSSDLLAQYRNNPEYTYERASQLPSWWDRFWSWVSRYVDSTMDIPGASELLVGLAVLAIGGLLVFAVHGLFRMRPTPPMDTSTAMGTEGAVTREAMERTDFSSRAEEAEAEESYRQAIRYHYLALLQRLMRVDLIDWTPDKANHALVRETSDHVVHDSFARATHVFEAVWYGDLAVDASSYERLRNVMMTARERSPTSSATPPTS